MNNELDELEKRVAKGRNYDTPPLHLWEPEFSGDIDIVITADGKWHHNGSEIKRHAIVKLFASILRREADGEYYLVTPGEKWRIKVELHALQVISVEWGEGHSERVLTVGLNTARQVTVGADHPLFSEPSLDNIAAVALDHGLSALFSRNSWYQLVEMAEKQGEQVSIVSGDQRYILG
jgi:hypothetical protein